VFFQVEKQSVKVAPNSATAAKKSKWQSEHKCQKWKQVILAMNQHWINKKTKGMSRTGAVFFLIKFCDVAQVAIIYKSILPNLATFKTWKKKNL
jgi:hypothetical protein